MVNTFCQKIKKNHTYKTLIQAYPKLNTTLKSEKSNVVGKIQQFGTVFDPDAAPSTGGFERISPLGAMQGCIAFFVGAGKPLRKTPFKAFGAQDSSGMGCRFLWVLSFGQAKESTSAVGPRPDIKNRRDSDTKPQANHP